MSEFNNWFGVRFPNIQATIDQTNDQESKLLKLCCKEVWQHQQDIVNDLKTQLNNMEVCYIQVKKERDNQWSGAAQMRSTLKCVSEHFEMNELDSCMPRVFEMIQEALRGDSK